MSSAKRNQSSPAEEAVPRTMQSVCPAGEVFPLPSEDDYGAEFKRLQKTVHDQRQLGREIVVVMGLGFVGAVMAAVVADSTNRDTGTPSKFVIGMQRP